MAAEPNYIPAGAPGLRKCDKCGGFYAVKCPCWPKPPEREVLASYEKANPVGTGSIPVPLKSYGTDTFEVLVRIERAKQDMKWGEQNHSPDKWMSILGEEYGELCKAVNEVNFYSDTSQVNKPYGDTTQISKELVQVAAVAKLVYESGVRNGWL